MKQVPLYPLRFEPIFKTAIWGGQRLRPMLGAPPSPEATGEAWVLSDQGDNQSRVAGGRLQGATLRQLMTEMPRRILGRSPEAHGRFPLLLKFLDARQPLSVQVHPDDERARHMTPPGGGTHAGLGKTEAWVILDSEPHSRIYAGLRPGVTSDALADAVRSNTVEQALHSFRPDAGDCVFLAAGTVHAIGAGLTLFEVQQTSDITYRLYDWGRVDPKTGRPRDLHVEESLLCTDFERGPCNAVAAELECTGPTRRERLVACPYFSLWRWRGSAPFTAGAAGRCRIVVGVSGSAEVRHDGTAYSLRAGEVLMLPAEVGPCECVPHGDATVLECGIPDAAPGNLRVA